ncbi:DNA-binding domain-containing protein [Marinomonas algicola]|uniref:HvfC/BufC N-terminal domain-containing protein n=1 Tax=Marinomonas algicola TaxID=2773454 RepID=UPI00174B59FC|nr:DNA-binding domain-containing protein [Marinomonas algicola]
MNTVTLKQTQEWMMTLLTVRGDLRQKVMSASSHTQLPLGVFASEDRFPAFYHRLNIYTAGYVMRLVECLKSEYPMLQRFMGERVFVDFAKAYIVTLPSVNPSLYDLGAGFAEFLETTRPKANYTPEEEPFFTVPTEIARIERAKLEVSLAKGFEDESFDRPNKWADFALFQQSFKVKTPSCLRLISLSHTVFPLMKSMEEGIEYEMPVAESNFLALSRMHYKLCALELEPWQFDFLGLCQRETEFLTCVAAVSEKAGLDQGELLASLMFWLPTAESKGLLKVER